MRIYQRLPHTKFGLKYCCISRCDATKSGFNHQFPFPQKSYMQNMIVSYKLLSNYSMKHQLFNIDLILA